jgi:opacity protein-like surface antigen
MTARRVFCLPVATALLASIVLVAPSARAADTQPDPAPAHAASSADKLAGVRSPIAAKQWSAALDELKRVNDSGNADWNNLMGFTLRKGKTPDLVGSEKYYDAALRIDPHHRNTLEYSGELYLMKGDLAKAQARLASLSTECAANCDQYAELKAAIERYKAAGKYVPSTAW